MIRAIRPSYLDIPNTVPVSVDITTQQVVSHFLFWSLEFPFLTVAPHKLRWFFLFKTVVVVTAAISTTIALFLLWLMVREISGSRKRPSQDRQDHS
jgi:NCS1 family nucleobase:cation symporter-1